MRIDRIEQRRRLIVTTKGIGESCETTAIAETLEGELLVGPIVSIHEGSGRLEAANEALNALRQLVRQRLG